MFVRDSAGSRSSGVGRQSCHVCGMTLACELRKQNLEVAHQVPIPMVCDGLKFEEALNHSFA